MFEVEVMRPKTAGGGHPKPYPLRHRKVEERQEPLTEDSPKSSCQQTGRHIIRA